MLTTSPYLHVRRPSPTTVEFSVSTLPPLTFPLRLALTLLYIIRLLLGLDVLLILYAKWTLSPYNHMAPLDSLPSKLLSASSVQYLASRLLQTTPGQLALQIATATPAWILLPIAGLLLYVVLLRIHTEERLLVLRGLGIQTSSTSATVLGAATTRFIPTEKIQDILINEAFKGFGVRYCLVVVVDGEEDVVVVFPKLLPRRPVVEQVWRGVRGCLYEDKGRPKLDEKF